MYFLVAFLSKMNQSFVKFIYFLLVALHYVKEKNLFVRNNKENFFLGNFGESFYEKKHTAKKLRVLNCFLLMLEVNDFMLKTNWSVMLVSEPLRTYPNAVIYLTSFICSRISHLDFYYVTIKPKKNLE